jgi:PTS system ascorbate-specific IIC component
MDIFLNFIKSFFGSAGLVVGVFALVGSILLRRTALQTIESTFVTVLGFLILSIGGGAISASLEHFKTMFNILITGSASNSNSSVIAASDAFSVGIMNSSQQIASISALMLLLAIVFNLLLARFSRFKNIYLSTHIVMYFCVGFTVMFMLCGPIGCMALDKLGLFAAVLGAGIIAIYTTLAPSLTTNTVEGLMHERNMNLCHHGLFSFALADGIGRLVGKMKRGHFSSIEDAHVPR